MGDDDWEDPFDNDDDNDDGNRNLLPNEIICEIAFFEYEQTSSASNNQLINENENDMEYFMKDHLKYFLGSHVLTNYDNISQLFHGTSILLKTFYEFPLTNILSYLRWYTYEAHGSFTFEKPPSEIKMHILQLFVKPIQIDPFHFESTVVLKTIWLSLVQRHWKKIIKERKDIEGKMKTFAFLANRERNNKYYHSSFPSLKGMLSVYKKN